MRENESPGTLAGVTGDDIEGWLSWIDSNLQREAAAREFIDALDNLDAGDQLPFLEISHEVYRAGWPIVPFGSVMEEARSWAGWASPAECKAYALACFNRMRPHEQAAFLEYVQRGRSA